MKIESLIIALLTIAVLAATHVYSFLYTPPSDEKTVKNVFIAQGTSFNIIARNLENEGLIRDAEKFTLFAKYRNAITRIKAGEYEFNTRMTPVEVLGMMVNGEVKDYTVTIPEGYALREIAEIIHATGIINKTEFIARATDPAFTASLDIDGTTVEGYLFPDTYRFTKGMTADEMIRRMVQKFNRVYNEVILKKPYWLKLSKKQIITLASIIEKETGNWEESPVISAVFHNRMKKRMRLESDPTVIYGIKNFNGNLTRRDLRTRTAYNTYQIYGLPPGPIANPGKISLEAAISPSQDPYLYFVSKNNGTHHFSTNLIEHNRAVHLYQKRFAKNRVSASKN